MVGSTPVRVYSVHAETRIPVPQKIEQYSAVIDDLKNYPKIERAIIMGDFNTWQPNIDGKTAKLFLGAGLKTPFGPQATFRRRS